jgi:hypothetical protein
MYIGKTHPMGKLQNIFEVISPLRVISNPRNRFYRNQRNIFCYHVQYNPQLIQN